MMSSNAGGFGPPQGDILSSTQDRVESLCIDTSLCGDVQRKVIHLRRQVIFAMLLVGLHRLFPQSLSCASFLLSFDVLVTKHHDRLIVEEKSCLGYSGRVFSLWPTPRQTKLEASASDRLSGRANATLSTLDGDPIYHVTAHAGPTSVDEQQMLVVSV
jgi:hypothetical protein